MALGVRRRKVFILILWALLAFFLTWYSKTNTKLNTTSLSAVSVIDDGDEPYSPGGGSENDDLDNSTPVRQILNQPSTGITVPLSAPTQPDSLDNDEIQRKMEEITREIEAQKKEIADMFQMAPVNLDEPYSPTSMLGQDTGENTMQQQMSTLENISIPSNLQDILNSINKVIPTNPIISQTTTDKDEEYTPSAIGSTASLASYEPASDYIPTKMVGPSSSISSPVMSSPMDVDMRVHQTAPSKLAQLTEEELLSMVPDDVQLPPIAQKRTVYNKFAEPLPPGLEDEYVP